MGLVAIEQAGEKARRRPGALANRFFARSYRRRIRSCGLIFFFIPVETGGLKAWLLAKNVPNGKGFAIRLPDHSHKFQGSQLTNHMADKIYNKLADAGAI